MRLPGFVPRTIERAVLDALALLFPVECAGCGAPDRSLCDACLRALAPDPSVHDVSGLRVVAGARYDGTVRRVILAFKQQGRTDVAAALAALLTAAIARVDPGAELVPVPSSRAGFRSRGYDPVRVLLRKTGFPATRVLAHARATSAQKTLGIDQRAANVRGSLRATRPLAGRRFVIVDDVTTTGATVEEAARAIRAADGIVVGGVCLAFTPRLSMGSDIATHQDYGGPKGAQ